MTGALENRRKTGRASRRRYLQTGILVPALNGSLAIGSNWCGRRTDPHHGLVVPKKGQGGITQLNGKLLLRGESIEGGRPAGGSSTWTCRGVRVPQIDWGNWSGSQSPRIKREKEPWGRRCPPQSRGGDLHHLSVRVMGHWERGRTAIGNPRC